MLTLALASDIAAATAINPTEYIISLSIKVQTWLQSIKSPQISKLSTARVEAHINSNTAYIFLNDRGVPIGSTFIEPLPERCFLDWNLTDLDIRSSLFMTRFLLDPEYIGKKIGDNMICQIKDKCVKEGKVMVLDTLETNTAVRRFYERNGFVFRGIFTDMEGNLEVVVACYVWKP
ncbi:hypothetical protein HK100_002082 [Physocladia obscura]|uniref:N-acetyltransferase domain-containing protein n=1 Tax=Physocladia obscura TaxID=109957 RepID=A0AAD5SWB1_9FUNG|nr:hypothetical protein HK100_002082 [Physocladia obscura]